MVLKTVKVPKEMESLFEKAQVFVNKYFQTMEQDPTRGTITIGGQRYVLIRAKSLRLDLARSIGKMMNIPEKIAEESASKILYNLAQTIGQSDAQQFHQTMGVKDPIAKLSAGPIHFSHSGWAFVDIFPESKPSSDKNYFLIYDHPYSFEAAAFIKEHGKTAQVPICVMNAGYSSGWCAESFGIKLDAEEIMCTAMGDKACRFVMSPPQKLKEYVKKYKKKYGINH
jgi:predicted hydrocarbon binding protein